MLRFIGGLIRPYRRTLVVIFLAMLVETSMSLVAALDSESEKLVIDALEKLMKGKTVIAIAHRLSTIRDADLIAVVKDGVVAGSGTHDELMARNGLYAELHRTQFDQGSDRVNDAATPAPELPRAL